MDGETKVAETVSRADDAATGDNTIAPRSSRLRRNAPWRRDSASGMHKPTNALTRRDEDAADAEDVSAETDATAAGATGATAGRATADRAAAADTSAGTDAVATGAEAGANAEATGANTAETAAAETTRTPLLAQPI